MKSGKRNINRKKKKIKKVQEPVNDPRDKKAERIVYVLLIILMIVGIVFGYKMSQEFTGMKLQKNGHFKKIETER